MQGKSLVISRLSKVMRKRKDSTENMIDQSINQSLIDQLIGQSLIDYRL